MDVDSKVIVVTGGASGIGYEIAKNLIEQNATVIILDKEKNSIGFDNYIQCDLSSNHDVDRAIETIRNDYQSIDILINNAAVVYNSPIVSLTPNGLEAHDSEKWNQLISVNINGTFYISSQVVKQMIINRVDGLIVNVSSICAKGNKGQSAYSASKAALNAMTTSWAKELMPLGIRVCGIAPGYMDFASTKEHVSEGVKAEILRNTTARRLGVIEEFMSSLFFVIQNDFFVGKTLEIDGGLVI